MKIFVIGYMGAGKTTFGETLARRLAIPFIDLDKYIESQTGESLSEIFTSGGESGFRELEAKMLRQVSTSTQDFVMACGGGTPCFYDNIDYLNSEGITVFLETSIPVLITRLAEENNSRPILAGLSPEEITNKVLTQLCERLPFYQKAKLKWNGDDLETAKEIENNVDTFISSYPSVLGQI